MRTLQESLDRYQGVTEMDRLRRDNQRLMNLLDIKRQLMTIKDGEIRRLESKLRAKETPHD